MAHLCRVCGDRRERHRVSRDHRRHDLRPALERACHDPVLGPPDAPLEAEDTIRVSNATQLLAQHRLLLQREARVKTTKQEKSQKRK